MVDSDKEDDLFESVSAMAERIGLEGEDKQKYIHEHMTRGGYRAVPTYVREDDDDREKDRGSGFFGNKSKSRDRDRRRSDDDWYSN